MKASLEKDPTLKRGINGRPSLYFAFDLPQAISDDIILYPDIVKLLLMFGARPSDRVQGKSIWYRFMVEVYAKKKTLQSPHWRSNMRSNVVKVVEALLEHGAALKIICDVNRATDLYMSSTNFRVPIRGKTASQIILEVFTDGEQTQLHQAAKRYRLRASLDD